MTDVQAQEGGNASLSNMFEQLQSTIEAKRCVFVRTILMQLCVFDNVLMYLGAKDCIIITHP